MNNIMMSVINNNACMIYSTYYLKLLYIGKNHNSRVTRQKKSLVFDEHKKNSKPIFYNTVNG